MRASMRTYGLACSGALALTAGAGCWSLSDPLPPGGTGATGGSAGSASGGGGEVGGGGGALVCEPATPPGAPPSEGPTTTGGWVFAIRSVRFAPAEGETLGYDLDGLCSCAPDPQGCVTPGGAPHCDGPGGRDNTLGPAMDGFIAGQSATSEYTEGAEVGHWTLLVEVGTATLPDDPGVELVRAHTGAPCCGGGPPAWDGSDSWPINIGFDPEPSSWVAEQAYVSSGVLVAHFSTLDLRLRHEDSWQGVRLTDVVLSATLSDAQGVAHLDDGVISGRVTEADIFWGLDTIHLYGWAFCTDNDAFYPNAKATVCGARDLSSLGSSEPCESASLAIGFTAVEVVLGGSASDTPGGQCQDPLRPIHDSCDAAGGGGSGTGAAGSGGGGGTAGAGGVAGAGGG